MKKLKSTISIILCLMFMFTVGGCGTSNKTSKESSKSSTSTKTVKENSTTSANLLPEGNWQAIPKGNEKGEPGKLEVKYVPKYAKGFTIEYYYGGAKIIATNIKKTPSSMKHSQRVLILPKGATKPKDTTWDYVIDGNVSRVVTLASAEAGHFEKLDAIDVVKGTSIKKSSCYIPKLKKALIDGKTKYIGSGKNFDKELIVSLKPQIVFVGGMRSNAEVAKKLKESGIPCLYFGDFAENNYMGRAEWIELVGAFIGKEQKAQDFMKKNEKGINEIIARTAKIKDKPTVLWFLYSSRTPHWNVKTDKDYANSIVSAVGGKIYAPKSDKNYVKLSNENFLKYMENADKIVLGISLNSYKKAKDITYFNQKGQIDFTKSKAYKNNDCYVVGHDWAQDTANALAIIKSAAIALYPDEFKDLKNDGKIVKFKAN